MGFSNQLTGFASIHGSARKALSFSFSFLRASVAATFDFEGLLKIARLGEIRHIGLRRVENLMNHSNDFSYLLIGATSAPNATANSDGNTVAWKLTEDAGGGPHWKGHYVSPPATAAGETFIYSVEAKAAERTFCAIRLDGTSNNFGGQAVYFDLTNGEVTQIQPGYTAYTLSLGNGWHRLYVKATSLDATGEVQPFIYVSNAATGGVSIPLYTGDGTSGIYVYGEMLENVTGQANQNPSGYVSKGELSAPYHGANADGVKYFATENGNAVVDNLVVQSTGPALPAAQLDGIHVEDGRINSEPNSSDGSSSTILVGTGDNTLSIKGAGSVAVSAGTAAGSGFGTATEGSDVTFNVTTAGTVDLAVSGSVTHKQVEAGSFSSSRIDTSGATLARNKDELDVHVTEGMAGPELSIVLKRFIPDQNGASLDGKHVDEGLFLDAAYSASLSGGRVVIAADKTDFVAGTRYRIGRSFRQNGSQVDVLLAVNGIVKLNTSIAGTLDYSASNDFAIGADALHDNTIFASFGRKGEITICKSALSENQLITETS